MGERANRLTPGRDAPADATPGPSHRIEKELSTLREEIGDLVAELDRRRRELFDVRLQLQRHPMAVPLAGFALALVLGGAVALLVRNERRRRRPSHKARQLRRALGRMVAHPERVGRGEPPPGEKILAAIGTAAATLLVRRALERAVPRPAQRAEQATGAQPPAAAT
jgi:hypothetical protein